MLCNVSNVVLQAHFLEGRKMPRRQDGARWIDAYKVQLHAKSDEFVQRFPCSTVRVRKIIQGSRIGNSNKHGDRQHLLLD